MLFIWQKNLLLIFLPHSPPPLLLASPHPYRLLTTSPCRLLTRLKTDRKNPVPFSTLFRPFPYLCDPVFVMETGEVFSARFCGILFSSRIDPYVRYVWKLIYS
jgi:hypothetical protein